MAFTIVDATDTKKKAFAIMRQEANECIKCYKAQFDFVTHSKFANLFKTTDSYRMRFRI